MISVKTQPWKIVEIISHPNNVRMLRKEAYASQYHFLVIYAYVHSPSTNVVIVIRSMYGLS